MTRIIFVGIHNKPGMEPLDSRTKSGKIIDEVIKGLDGRECLKTNLFAYDFIPEKDAWKIARGWITRNNADPENDIVVWLGKDVQRHAPHEDFPKSIIVPHPASRQIKKDEYIKDLISKILQHAKVDLQVSN